MLRIAVYSIAKNEQNNVKKFVESCQGADVIVVGVDPGDTTGDLLAAYGVKVVRVDLPRFRFDHYRNAVLREIPEDIDICISMDMDETLPSDWRQIIEKHWVPGTTRIHYWLQWSVDTKFLYDRIHARHGYQWMHANHECVLKLDPTTERSVQVPLTITHNQDTAKDRSKNLGLLELAVEEEPFGVRMRWYLAREYLSCDMPKESIKHFKKYFQLNPIWKPEMSWAAIFTAHAYIKLCKYVEAEVWLHAAVRFCPDLRDPYFELAGLYSRVGRLHDALTEIDNALKIFSDKHSFFHGNGAYTKAIHYMKAGLHERLNQPKLAEKSYKRAERMDRDK